MRREVMLPEISFEDAERKDLKTQFSCSMTMLLQHIEKPAKNIG